MGQIDNLYWRVIQMNAAPGESRGQNVENSGFKRKGRLDNALVICSIYEPWFK